MGKRMMLGKRALGLGLSLSLVIGLVPSLPMDAQAAAEPDAVRIENKDQPAAEYRDLQTGLSALENGGKAILLSDAVVDENEALAFGETVESATLDLNGCTFDVKGKLTGGEYTNVVIESEVPGKFVSSGTVDVYVQGFTADKYTITGGTISKYFTIDGGTATITGGEFSGGFMADNGGNADVSLAVSGNAMFNGMELYANPEGDFGFSAVLSGGYYDKDPSALVEGDMSEYVTIAGEVEKYTSQSDWAVSTETYPWRIASSTKSLETATIAAIPDQVYTGSAIEPDLQVSVGDHTLVKGTDYQVSFTSNVNAGTATATLTGTGDYEGETSAEFTIVPKPLGDSDMHAWTTGGDVQLFKGEPVKPGMTIRRNYETDLVEGKDFEVKYLNNDKIGKATIVAAGKGNYSESTSCTFYIVDPSEVNYAIPTATFVRVEDIPTDDSGKVREGEAKLTIGFTIDPEVEEAEFYADLTSSSGSIEGLFYGPLTTARPQEEGDVGGHYWTVDPDGGDNSFTYTAYVPTIGLDAAQTIGDPPSITGAKDGDTVYLYGTGIAELQIGSITKWMESDESNRIAVPITKDSVGKTFTAELTPSLEDATVAKIADQTYTGKAITPKLTVTTGDLILVQGTDFDVTYKNNINVGTATAVLTAKSDKCTGSRTVTFKIKAKSCKPTITLNKASYVYDGKQKTPTVKVTVNGKSLKKGTDFTVTYASGRKVVGSYKVTVKLKGNYSGSGTKTFKITKAANKLTAKGKSTSVSLASVKKGAVKIAKTKVYTVKNGAGTITYKKASGNGALSVNSKTGSITVKKGTKKGTYTVKVTVKAAGNKNYKAAIKTVSIKITVR
ncbi:MAG: hypothetical protein IJM27_10330 [Eubacterium sp.]|nr:hypothetical protein [Eubacterium sp.]